MSKTKQLVKEWFQKWEDGDFQTLPLADDFQHTSPYGTISGKKEYLAMVEANQEKFLNHQFIIHDELYDGSRACIRYTAVQESFSLPVSEWYFIENGTISEIISYYHIGNQIREDRQLKTPSDKNNP